jgi:23S rRNA pseudouridine1911/1915/1917 synthase
MIYKVVSLKKMSQIKQFDFIVTTEDINQRLDQFLRTKLPEFSRNYLQALIKNNYITLNSRLTKASYILKQGDHIIVRIPASQKIEIVPENINLDIIYKDQDIAIINKPQDMVVYPAKGNYTATLANALLFHFQSDGLSSLGGENRPGIVHRLDKDTSGLLIIALNNQVHRCLAKQIQKNEVKRVYRAIAEGNILKDEGTINAPIARNPNNRKKMAVIDSGRHAVTHYKVIERFGTHTYLELVLETGRTHQIRVHLNHIGHPILGDPVYGRQIRRFNLKGQALHAYKLTLIHPRTGEHMTFYGPLPEYFIKILEILRKS